MCGYHILVKMKEINMIEFYCLNKIDLHECYLIKTSCVFKSIFLKIKKKMIHKYLYIYLKLP